MGATQLSPELLFKLETSFGFPVHRVTSVKDSIDLFDVIVFIRATDHVITILFQVTNNCGWQKHFRFH